MDFGEEEDRSGKRGDGKEDRKGERDDERKRGTLKDAEKMRRKKWML